MPNYGLVIGSKFRPFSYQEMLAPVQQSTEAHQALEDAYNELEVKAGILENILDSQIDSPLYTQYQNYMKDLDNIAKSLATEGLSPSSRQQVLQLNRRFATDIIPIQEAVARKDAMDKMEREQFLKDPTTIFEGRAATTPLQDFYNNRNLAYRSYSGALLTKQAAEVASKIANNITRTSGTLDAYTNNIIEQAGWTVDEFRNALNDPNSDKGQVLSTITDAILKSSGLTEWSNYNNIKDNAINWINQGLYSVIGPSKQQIYTNQEAVLRAKHQQDLDILRMKANQETLKEGKGYQTKTLGNVLTNPEAKIALTTVDGKFYQQDKKGKWFTTQAEAIYDIEDWKRSGRRHGIAIPGTSSPKLVYADDATTKILNDRIKQYPEANFDLQTQEIPYRPINPTYYNNVLTAIESMGPKDTYYASLDENGNLTLKDDGKKDLPNKDDITSISLEILGRYPVIVITTNTGESLMYKMNDLESEVQGLYNDVQQRQMNYKNSSEADKSRLLADMITQNDNDINTVLDDMMEELRVYNTEEVKPN